MDRLEFASPAWMAFFAQCLVQHLQATEPTATLTRCEVYLDAPVHLCEGAVRRLAWTCRNEQGVIRFEARECSFDEADVKTVGDYEAFRDLVRFVVDDANVADFHALLMAHVGAGRIVAEKDRRPNKPAPNWAFHNDVAARTA